MTRDTADTNDPRPTIRGDQLLPAFKCLEHYCANGVAPRFLEAHFQAQDYKSIDHPFGFIHWIGQMSIRAHCRGVIERIMNKAKRHDADFIIEEVVLDVIVSASPEELGKHGLSKNDKKHFTEILTRFFSAVACEEITAKDLASSTRRP